MKQQTKLPKNPIPGFFNPHAFPQVIPILGIQVGWIEPVYKEASCVCCGKTIKIITGACWTRVLGGNEITCSMACATKICYEKCWENRDPLKEILHQAFLLSIKPSQESLAVFSQK